MFDVGGWRSILLFDVRIRFFSFMCRVVGGWLCVI